MINSLSQDTKRFLGFLLFVLFLFSSGFFIQYGREAALSGSWKYIMNHQEEWLYWNFAQAHAQAEKGPNPFSYEQRESSAHLLSYPTTQGVGSLARLLKVNVLFFFPFWHIGAPFLIWLALFFSAWRLWKYPLLPSAAVSLILCLSTLHLKGVYPWILTRFSRPADFLGVVIFCLSLVMTSRRPRKTAFLILNCFAAMAIWMSPFFAATGLFVIILEILWQTLIEKHKEKILWLGSALVTFFISLWIFSVHVQTMTAVSKNAWFSELTTSYPTSLSKKSFPALILFALIAAMVFGFNFYKKHFLKMAQGPSFLNPLERFTLYMFATEPLFATAFSLFPRGAFFELGIHRYMNFLIQLAVLAAWSWESVVLVKDRGVLRKAFFPLLILLSLSTAVLLFFEKTNCLLWGCKNFIFDTQNHSVLLFSLCPLLVIVMLIVGYPGIRRLVQKRAFVVLLSLALCFTGFAIGPWNMRFYNNRFPFNDAYAWLKTHASSDDVVLTPSTIYGRIQYLFFYTGLRSYSSEFEDSFSLDPQASDYRKLFVFSLLNGVLDKVPLQGLQTMDEKIRHLKMDYVLISRWSPFLQDVERQLAGFLTKVYEDNKAILWKISA